MPWWLRLAIGGPLEAAWTSSGARSKRLVHGLNVVASTLSRRRPAEVEEAPTFLCSVINFRTSKDAFSRQTFVPVLHSTLDKSADIATHAILE